MGRKGTCEFGGYMTRCHGITYTRIYGQFTASSALLAGGGCGEYGIRSPTFPYFYQVRRSDLPRDTSGDVPGPTLNPFALELGELPKLLCSTLSSFGPISFPPNPQPSAPFFFVRPPSRRRLNIEGRLWIPSRTSSSARLGFSSPAFCLSVAALLFSSVF